MRYIFYIVLVWFAFANYAQYKNMQEKFELAKHDLEFMQSRYNFCVGYLNDEKYLDFSKELIRRENR